MELSTDYFRNLLKSETNKLNELCDQWSQHVGEDKNDQIPDDATGQIRSVIGQARLLMGQRFNQFRGLIDDCQFKRGQKETKLDDLQGFWDMIYFQVEDVYKKFDALDRLKSNQWVEVENVIVNKKAKKPKDAKAKCVLREIN